MADIADDVGQGLDIRNLISGTLGDVVGVFPSGTFTTTGSVEIFNVGSVKILSVDSSNTLTSPLVANGSYLMIAGSISSMPPVTAESASDYKVSGTWDGGGIGSASLVAGNFNGSVYPLHLEGGSSLLVVGSVFQSTTPWAVSGNALGVSGTAFNTVWIGIGSVVISGTSIPPTRGIGSVLLVPGSLEVYQTTADDLDVNISAFPLFDLGSPGMQQVTYIVASGTYVSEVWTPGLGSKVEIHGWEISSDVPQEARLVLSGTSAGFVTIARYRLPASGTILKTLVHPITPGAVEEGLGLGTTVTGSTDITIYGRDKE